MSRQERLQEYKRMAGPKGQSNDERNLKYWAERASENSQLPPRAKDGPMVAAVGTSEGVAPKEHSGDMRAKAKADHNDAGNDDFMPGVRRQA